MMHLQTGIAWQLGVEHRLTVLEQQSIVLREATGKMEKRLTLQERVMVVALVSMAALAHEKVPWLAKVLVALVKTAA